MKVRAIKRGQILELLEQINNIPDNAEILVELQAPRADITGGTLSDDEKLAKLNQLFGTWKDKPELIEIFTELDKNRHAYGGREIS
ncbi:hypothetical protein DSM106972_048090 [Dulcicalothrix desertica PCC 7102]|uniref:Uncharacterized protein n=1 Tax=Dulcicalothrix desertica PCC 7102 TaxID=232991 RepID=A0A3S1CI16_9CYAN|nr:hypothetical protein [Dulcicalothrix desertica]RUT03895.1 hypothetical protein DSM106972_048090 [Dulcicalothrix desertica PCC 7102]TWH43695.1 hypothetical protein CAL7102_07438 [Dulcicalothrix desertica PCC 7102]